MTHEKHAAVYGWAWKAAALLAVAGIAAGAWRFAVRRPPPEDPPRCPPDPRLSYEGPFRNVRPGVGYVGDGRCVDCHQREARAYATHPMARSLVPIARAIDRPIDAEHNSPFRAFGVKLWVDRQGDRVSHRQTVPDDEGRPVYDFAHEVSHAVGSGARGHSYLTVRDGYVMQTPISWFTQKAAWDLSPGFPRWSLPGRLVTGPCLYCHANRVEPVADTRNRYHEPVFRGHGIGCERCHGPGELHVRTSAKDDIVNPRRLEPALSEAVCQQCHLQGAARVLRRGRGLNDYRPGMPLEEFWSVYVQNAGAGRDRAVSHVEQMHQSACYQGGRGRDRMGCVSCHDPHEVPAAGRRVAHYRERCLRCHQSFGCSLPEVVRREREPEDSCVACHMPRERTADVAHVAATDHRVLRDRKRKPERGKVGGPPLLDFHRGAPDLRDAGQGRDVAVAIYQLTLRGQPLTETAGDFAVGLLDAALKDCPDDPEAWEAKAKLLQTMQRPAAAIETCEAILARSPRHEGALAMLGAIHRDRGDRAEAVAYWRRAVEVNPWAADYRKQLTQGLVEQAAWEEAQPHCRRWLELDPGSGEARHAWVRCLLAEGRRDEARGEFAKLRALRPANLEKLEAWFAGQTR